MDIQEGGNSVKSNVSEFNQKGNLQQNAISKGLQIKQLDTKSNESQFEKDLKNNLKEKLLLAKQEVLYKEKVIISSVFESVFSENYSDGFDSDSVQKSLEISYSSGLEPKITIDEKKFRFNSKITEGVAPFNENESKFTPYQKFRNREYEFDALGRMNNFFQDSNVIPVGRYTTDISQHDSETTEQIYVGDWDDEISNVQLDYQNFTKQNNQRRYEGLQGVKEVFKIAQMRAKQETDKIYRKEILPKIIKKYGKNK